MKTTTVQKLRDAGFQIPEMPAGLCQCGHESGEHVLVASFGEPKDGGILTCQFYPEKCSHASTWSVPGYPGNSDIFKDGGGPDG